MSLTIRIGREVEDRIQQCGKFGETHDDVLMRLLGLKKKKLQKKRRLPKGQLTRQEEFRPYILKALLAGKLPAKEVIRQIGMVVPLKPMDLEKRKSGQTCWENNVQWTRQQLVNEGLLKPVEESGRGYWELTAAGIEEAKKLIAAEEV